MTESPPNQLADALAGQSLRAYWQALGQFVSAFSLVEENMQVALWKRAGLDAPVAPALFSGVKVDAAAGLIKRLAEAQKWSDAERKELDEVVLQLGEITRVRNDILHFGASENSPGEWSVSNKLLAHTEDRIRTTRITTKILLDMTGDLLQISLRLAFISASKSLTQSVRENLEQLLGPSWRYKPERRGDPQQKRQKPPRKQPHPREPSQA